MKAKKIPLRMCVGCREMKQKCELVRIVKSPDGEISVDITNKAPGRGAYVCKESGCLSKAIKNKALARTFKTAVSDEIYTLLEGTI